MGIFEFFRKKIAGIEKERDNGENDKKEKIKFEELEKWLLAKKGKEKEEEKKVIFEISELILKLVNELNTEKSAIEKIDLKERKEQEKVKLLVLEALSKYSENIESLVEELSELRLESIDSCIVEINSLFVDFEKKSHMNYEKATFLVGKEMAAVKNSIKNFFKNIDAVLTENKQLIENIKIIDSSIEKFGKIKDGEKEKMNIIKELDELNEKIHELEEKEKLSIEKINKIKNSEEYISNKKIIEEAVMKKEKLDEEILQLKKMIDFKALKKEFHSDEKKMNLIHEYEQDFEQIFKKDNLLSFIEKDKREKIAEEIEIIKKEKKKIEEDINQKDKLEEIDNEFESLQKQKENLIEEKEKIEKSIEKIENNIGAIKNEISLTLKKISNNPIIVVS